MVEVGEKAVRMICGDSPDELLTALYRGVSYRVNNFAVEIQIGAPEGAKLFVEDLEIACDHRMAAYAVAMIQRELSKEAWNLVLKTLCHSAGERGNAALDFLSEGLSRGAGIVHEYARPSVLRVMEMARETGNETHRFLEFIRFQQKGGVLFSKIAPKCQVLPLVGEHFHQRLPEENWMIYDETRNSAAFQKAGEGWGLLSLGSHAGLDGFSLLPGLLGKQEDPYEDLWKVFFKAIAIEERRSENRQRSMLPLWFRKNMTEFWQMPL